MFCCKVLEERYNSCTFAGLLVFFVFTYSFFFKF